MALNAVTDFIWDEAALAALLASTSGDIARDLGMRAERVTSQAKQNATERPGPKVDTGRLRSSISWRLGSDGQGIYADIGTGVPYGRILELGLTRNGRRFPFLVPALEAARI
jgi:Bacteriophage HK97-gp10, putative tail-component